MRAVYLINKSKEELHEILRGIFQNLASNILEFVDEGDVFITIKNNKKLFRAVLKDSTIYVNELGSGMGEMLEAENIVFSCTHPVEAPDERIEDYFRRNSFLRSC